MASAPTPNTTVSVGRTGRYVRVQLSDGEHLSLAEVKVMGQETPSPITTASAAAGASSPFSSTPLFAEGMFEGDGDDHDELDALLLG